MASLAVCAQYNPPLKNITTEFLFPTATIPRAKPRAVMSEQKVQYRWGLGGTDGRGCFLRESLLYSEEYHLQSHLRMQTHQKSHEASQVLAPAVEKALKMWAL